MFGEIRVVAPDFWTPDFCSGNSSRLPCGTLEPPVACLVARQERGTRLVRYLSTVACARFPTTAAIGQRRSGFPIDSTSGS